MLGLELSAPGVVTQNGSARNSMDAKLGNRLAGKIAKARILADEWLIFRGVLILSPAYLVSAQETYPRFRKPHPSNRLHQSAKF